MKHITVVPNFHYDVAYLKPYAGYLPDCFRILDEALRLMDEDPGYCFLVEQTILLEEYWEKRPEQRDALKRHAASGRLEVGPGMYVMPDMNLPVAGSLFEQARLGFDWLRTHLGVQPTTCWIADCWGHHAQLPQMLGQCGYGLYVFWRCMRPDVLRNDFVWRGLDGSEIQAHWLARGYANLRFPTEAARVNELELALQNATADSLKQLLHEIDAYGPSDHVMACNGGDMAFPQASGPQTLGAMQTQTPDATLAFGTPARFAQALPRQDLPTFDGEFNSSLQGTFTSNIWIKQRTRALVHRLLSLQTAGAVLNQPLQLEPVWKLTLKQEFHDILCGTITDDAIRDCDEELGRAEALIEQQTASFSAPNPPNAWFNPTNHPRREVVQVGEERLLIDVPALGQTCRKSATALSPQEPDALPLTFSNPWYEAQIDQTGHLVSLQDADTHTQLVEQGPLGFGALGLQADHGDLWLNFEGPLDGGSLAASMVQNTPDPWDRYGQDALTNRRTFTSPPTTARVVAQNDQELVVEQRGEIAFWRIRVAYTTRTTFRRFSPRIDFRTTLEPAGKNFRVRVAFPTPLAQGTRRDEIPFGIQPRDAGEHPVQNWTSLSRNGRGLAVINRGIPAANAHDGTIMLTLMRSVAMEYKTSSALSYMEGQPQSFAYALLPFADSQLAEVVAAGQDFNRDLVPTSCMDPDAANLALSWALGSTSVMLDTLSSTPQGIYMRLYESAGKPCKTTLKTPKKIVASAHADGLQQVRGPWRPITGESILDFTPFEIKHLIFRSENTA